MDLLSVCFFQVFALLFAQLFVIQLLWGFLHVSFRSAAHVGRESWDVDDRRTDEHTVDMSDSSEDERDCTPGNLFCVAYDLPSIGAEFDGS